MASNTLVKYNNPVIKTVDQKKESDSSKTKEFEVAPASEEIKNDTIDVLNTILPPREWEEAGQTWIQSVSSTPSSRLDVINLKEQFDMTLKQLKARETGICGVRRELYSQCFDEIMRQVTINCAERGLLLFRMRNELEMTMSTYRTLYESGMAFGIRKALQAEQNNDDVIAKVSDLTEEKLQLEKSVAELKQKIEQIQRRNSEIREAKEKKHLEKNEFFRKTNQQLKTLLEGIMSPKTNI